jgi:hypothetical protein
MRLAMAVAAIGSLSSCPAKKPPPPDEPSGRCEVNLTELGLFSTIGTGASAKAVESATELIGGSFAQGQVGDFLLQNDRVRVLIQQPTRLIGPSPYGGTIIDADLKRGASEPGHDAFGKLAPLYAFGRTVNVTKVEVLQDGSQGGYAVVAATGQDAVDDYINVPNMIDGYLGAGVKLVLSPDTALPFTVTTYYVLSPGETRVRALTAVCNTSHDGVITEMGDLIDPGGSIEFFNPMGCTNGLGVNGCLVDPAGWFGFQGDGVAYGYRAYSFSNTSNPAQNAVLTVAGMTAVLANGQNQQGLLTWVDQGAQTRPGSFAVGPAASKSFLRDFFVGKDLAEVSSTLLSLDSSPHSRMSITVKTPGGQPAPAARVAILGAESGKVVTVAVTDTDGTARADLPPGNYLVSAGGVGRAIAAPSSITVPSTGGVTADLTLGDVRTLTVNVKDPTGKPLSAKVLVVCPGGPCAATSSDWRKFHEVESLPATVQAIGYADGQGRATLSAPPGQYQVLVSRGPEYSGWPSTYPAQGQAVDLTTADQSLDAVLAHVVDTTGWMSADLHVHAMGSPDSNVDNSVRVATFAAEGVDVLVSTDHDFVMDYAPLIKDLGLTAQMTSMIGCEITPFDYGHQQAYPITRKDTPNGGAFDWGGGDGPSLRLDQIFQGLRDQYPGVVVQMNHPRGFGGGSLTQLKVDTLTGASHADPAQFRQAPNPAATASDSKLFSPDFDAFEVMNGLAANRAVLNDWMTFLSKGWVKTATGVSDTHYVWNVVGGYGRTWVKVGVDAPGDFSPATFATAIKAHHAVLGSGPFVTMSARKADLSGTPSGNAVGVGDTLSVTPSTDQVELTVDVQAPEWMQFDSVEIYTHTTGREAFAGDANYDWPDSRILQKKTYTPSALPVEAVPGLPSTFHRVHVTEKFLVTPTADTWYVAMVRAGSGSHALFPLAWDSVSCSGGVCTARQTQPEALTNPIFIDADGSGAYDRFPLAQGLVSPKPLPKPREVQRRVPTIEELQDAVRKALTHDHSGR